MIIPIYKGKDEYEILSKKCEEIKNDLINIGVRVKLDLRDSHKPGWKFNEYEVKGVPIRVAIGMRDLNEDCIEIFRRDLLSKEKIKTTEILNHIPQLLKIYMQIYLVKLNYF